MKIKSGLELKDIAGSWVVVPTGMKVGEFKRLLTLNETGAFIWKKLEAGAELDDLVRMTLMEYDIDEATARDGIVKLINSMRERGLIE